MSEWSIQLMKMLEEIADVSLERAPFMLLKYMGAVEGTARPTTISKGGMGHRS
jgi:hypothetical protein